jgi:hypothetical protein
MGEIADILDRAADLIEPEGAWIQGRLSNSGDTRGKATCFCVVGAIYAAAGEDDEKAADHARDVLAQTLGYADDNPSPEFAGDTPVVAWNDTPKRKQAEVVAKLREAAAKARAEAANA